jgi:short-subunit dehydrogenase
VENSLHNKVVVITGASSGIGRATAIEFARRGANVIIAARALEALEETADQCRSFGNRVVVIRADVTNDHDVHHLARVAAEKFGSIDIWVNNAGVTALGDFLDIPPDVFRRIIETNFFGYVNGARAVLPHFRQQNQGVLINVGSELSKFTMPYATAYACSKFAVRALSDSLRQELLDTNIHICTVMPASIDTPLFQHAGNYYGRAVKAPKPIYTPEQVANAIVQLAERPQREVYVGNIARQLTALKHAAPELQERLIKRMVEREHFEETQATHSPGNLFHPAPPFSVSGGWKRRERLRRTRSSAVNVALFAPLAASAWLLWSKRQRPESRQSRYRKTA